MNERIAELVRERLAAAVECAAKQEIIEELTSDAQDRFADLTAQGRSEEDALREVAESMGDLREIVAFINEGDRRQREEARSRSFEEIEGSLRQLARDLAVNVKPGLRTVADDLRSAAIHVRDVAREAKGPIGEMGREVGRGIGNAFRSEPRAADGAECYRYEIDDPAVRGIEIHTAGGNVTFCSSEDDVIRIEEYTGCVLPEDKRAEVSVTDGVLRIGQGARSSVGRFFFGFGALQSDFRIALPMRVFERLSVQTAGGAIDLRTDREIAELDLRTLSGGITCVVPAVGRLTLSTVSGEISAQAQTEKLAMTTTSGAMRFDGVCTSARVKSVSGHCELRLSETPEELSAETVSADLTLTIPDNDGFAVRYKWVSGRMTSDFPLDAAFGTKNGFATYGTRKDREYTLSTVSGTLRICRA